MEGTVVHLFTATGAEAAMTSVPEIRAVAGKGVDGDRYFNSTGTFSKKKTPDRQITLIEIEAISDAVRDYKIELAPIETRRNVVTRGVALNHLVGRNFTVGEVRLRGLKLCDPCGHLEKLTRTGVKDALANRGGLRCEILRGGVIRCADAIDLDDDGEEVTEKVTAVRS
jgi:MOSC domain-containing protein YiiM